MTVGSMLRWMVWISCLACVLLGARVARAAAPMCDQRGASAIAPPPVLPVPDVKLEPALPLGCDSPVHVSVAPLGPTARSHLAIEGDAFEDAWLKPGPTKVTRFGSSPTPGQAVLSLPPSAGFRRGVFRPPRSAVQ
jgi:hypothetical protein